MKLTQAVDFLAAVASGYLLFSMLIVILFWRNWSRSRPLRLNSAIMWPSLLLAIMALAAIGSGLIDLQRPGLPYKEFTAGVVVISIPLLVLGWGWFRKALNIRRLVRGGLDYALSGDPDQMPSDASAKLPLRNAALSGADRARWLEVATRGLHFVAIGIAWLSFAPLIASPFIRSSKDAIAVTIGIVPVAILVAGLGALLRWRLSRRVLLLRPFNHADLTDALRIVVQQKLSTLGNVITLSDANYRPNYLLEIARRIWSVAGVLWAPIFRNSYRVAGVRNPYGFLVLADTLDRRQLLLGLRSFQSGGQAVNIRTSDAWWKRVINVLMNSCDVIVMDISVVGQGSSWEIEQLEKRGIAKDCIFIAHNRARDEAARVLAALQASAQPHIHYYDDSGRFLDILAFDAALSHCLSSLAKQPRSLEAERRRVIRSRRAAIAFRIGLAFIPVGYLMQFHYYSRFHRLKSSANSPENPDLLSLYQLGEGYIDGCWGDCESFMDGEWWFRDTKKGLRMIREAADKGDEMAMRSMVLIFRHGGTSRTTNVVVPDLRVSARYCLELVNFELKGAPPPSDLKRLEKYVWIGQVYCAERQIVAGMQRLFSDAKIYNGPRHGELDAPTLGALRSFILVRQKEVK